MAYVEFRSNPLYVQGPDALLELRRYTHHLGTRFLILTACGPLTEWVKERVTKSFTTPMVDHVQTKYVFPRYSRNASKAAALDAQNITPVFRFENCSQQNVTWANVNRVASIAKEMQADCIIAIGGGRVLDMARAAQPQTGARIVLCPSHAASNASATPQGVVYADDGVTIVDLIVMPAHPDVVLVDMNLILQSPIDMLVAGIGDCMSCYYESLFAMKQYLPDKSILYYSREMHGLRTELFYEHGLRAIQAAKSGISNLSLETVVAEILYFDGPSSSMMEIFFSHMLVDGLHSLEPCHKLLHGALVGYGAIPMMVFADAPDDILFRYVDFCMSIGIPVNFQQLGIENIPMEQLVKVGEISAAGRAARRSVVDYTPEVFYKNMILADKIVTDYINS